MNAYISQLTDREVINLFTSVFGLKDIRIGYRENNDICLLTDDEPILFGIDNRLIYSPTFDVKEAHYKKLNDWLARKFGARFVIDLARDADLISRETAAVLKKECGYI